MGWDGINSDKLYNLKKSIFAENSRFILVYMWMLEKKMTQIQ